MKKNYNMTAIFYVATLKKQGRIDNWALGADVYHKITGEEISPSVLSRRAKDVLLENVSLYDYFQMMEKTDFYLVNEKDENKVVGNESDVVYNQSLIYKNLSITKDDLVNVFGVDLENDSPEEMRKKVLNKISNERFLLEYLGFDPAVYEVSKMILGGWTTPVKLGTSSNQFIKMVENEKFSVCISKRKEAVLYYSKEECEKFLEDFLSKRCLTPFDFFDESKKDMPNLGLNPDLMMVCPGLELHLGKLATVSDYEDYSTKQALWRIREVAREIVEYQKQVKAGTLVMGVGNDYFNSDTVDDKTTGGTPQHNDSRFKEVYLYGKIGYLRLIESLKNEFDKIILKGHVGNHDEKTSFCLLSNLSDVYAMTGDPKVDVASTYEDYRFSTCQMFGDNLIIFTHGKSSISGNLSDEKIANAARELFPEEFQKARNIYIFVGHLHQDRETKYNNCTIIRTASLTGIDDYHVENLFLGQRQGHSVYLIDKKKGYLGKRNITIAPDDRSKGIKSIERGPKVDIMGATTRSLNLSNESINMERLAARIRQIDKLCEEEKKACMDKLSSVLAILKYNGKLSDEEINALLKLLGFDEKVSLLNQEKQVLSLSLKNES